MSEDARANVTVAVSGMSAGDSPAPGLGVIRCLRESDSLSCRIVGLSYDTLETGVFASGAADAVFMLPYPSAGRDAMRAGLESLLEREEIDVLIPTLDAELPLMADLSGWLDDRKVRTLLPSGDRLAARDKARLSELCDACGLATPRTEVVRDLSRLDTVIGSFSPPFVVKGPYYEARVCWRPEEAVFAANAVFASWGLPILVQEFIEGDEYDIAALADRAGGVAGLVPMRKMMITPAGKAWGGITIADPQLESIARRLIAALEWRGPCEIELIRARGDGRLNLIEINPRFPAWIYLSRAAGQNLPEVCVRLAMGLDVPSFCAAPAGVMFARVTREEIVDMRELEAISTSGFFVRNGRKDGAATI